MNIIMDTVNGTATIEYVTNVAEELYKDVKDGYKKIKTITPQTVDELHKDIINKYKNLAQMYPIVVRHIVYEKKFYTEVFKKFLLHVSNHKAQSREEQLEVQAEYLVFMLRHEYPREDKKKIYEYRNAIVKELKENDKKLEESIKQANEEIANDKKISNEVRRERLREYLLRATT